jgi:hypothetical protein
LRVDIVQNAASNAALASVLELSSPLGSSHMSTEREDSMVGLPAPESPVSLVRAEFSAHQSSVCISDGSAASDEDVLASADVDDDDELLPSLAHRQVPNSTSMSMFARDPARDAASKQGYAPGGPGTLADAAATVQMQMVQQYNQFEKVGSTLEGVAEDEQEEEEGQVRADDSRTIRPMSARSLSSPFASDEGVDAADRDVNDDERLTPSREISGERRKITPRGEHERGDKPTRPDDRRAGRRAGRPSEQSASGGA